MKKQVLLFFIILFIFCSCNKEYTKIVEEKFIFGTFIKIVVYSKDVKNARNIIKKAIKKMEDIDLKYNNYSKKSIVSKLNLSKGKKIKIDNELVEIIKEAKYLSKLTNGKYDISILPVLELWGFNDYKAPKLPEKDQLRKTLKLVNYKDIMIENQYIWFRNKNMKIDFSSLLKGYAINEGRKILIQNGIKHAFITAVSSITTIGNKLDKNEWKIAIENPKNRTKYLGILGITNKSIGVSGDYQNYITIKGKQYSHLLNAKTGYPNLENKMIVVIADNSYIADIYSTALFMLSGKEIITLINKKENMECLVVDKNMKLFYSKNFKKYLTK